MPEPTPPNPSPLSSPAVPPAVPRRAVVVECPAKVNLHLRVGPVRGDGFHPLLTWMCTVGLFDTLKMERVPGGPASPAVRLTCDPPDFPSDDRNLVVRIVRGWAEHLAAAGRPIAAPIAATLAKRTPVGAGLGGGSSDAACALLAAAALWRVTGEPAPSAEDLSAFAGRFGSDIPFFVHGPSSVCTGRGEVVRPTPPPAVARWVVLLLPPVHMPTPDVYRRFDAMRLGRTEDVEREPDWSAWAKLPATELMARLANDLEPPAFDLRPDLAELRGKAERSAGRVVRMSGSGSSLFTLFDSEAEARVAHERLATDLDVRTEIATVGPPVEVRPTD